MAVNGVGNTGSSAAPEQVVRKTGDRNLGKDDFMKLLTAQLKNQDPNNPTDSKELVTQLSQLSSVEQLTQMSTKLDALTRATNSGAANSSAALIGKSVNGVADTVALLASGSVEGAVKFKAVPDKATVSVLNEAGRVVRTFDIDKPQVGLNGIKWDGMDNGGDRATPGKYTFQVAATDKAGTAMEADMSVSGVVRGVFYENGAPELEIGGGDGVPGTRMPLSNLTSISQ